MKIGMTGTRNGLTEAQKQKVLEEIPWGHVTELHSGDCIGADEQLHYFAKSQNIKSIGHPPSKTELRAYCKFDEEHEPKNYFARNRDIVNSSEFMYGFPPTEKDVGKGGTWYTINYAIKQGKPIKVITPSGRVTIYNGEQ